MAPFWNKLPAFVRIKFWVSYIELGAISSAYSHSFFGAAVL